MTTLEMHLRRVRGLGDLAGVFEAFAVAGTEIGGRLRRARLNNAVGASEGTNIQGEVQQKLDVFSDQCILARLRESDSVGVYGSEEQSDAIVIRPRSEGGEYCVLADPLDGSSNIDVAAPVGTIFSIFRNVEDGAVSVTQPGSAQVGAGYVLYASSILMVTATPAGVDMFVLDPRDDIFYNVKRDIRVPGRKKIYSINEGYTNAFSDGFRRYLDYAHSEGYGARYIGSMVADVHRTLVQGGVFIYPGTAAHANGKLRLMYEANPMAYVIEHAGGKATTGSGAILDVQPAALHERTPVILGSKHEVDNVDSHLR